MSGKASGPTLVHSSSNNMSPSASSSPGPILNKEVKLDELSKYFHLPEKAVAKELGICLTSLKKLCRSYGITRWPFRKLKSLERTMRKVQTEESWNSGGQSNGDGDSKTPVPELKRKPYTVGNKTVFLSDEELEVFKMTMGKDQASELKPTPISTLEPSLINNATMAAASSALASVIRASNENSNNFENSYGSGNTDADEENCTVSAEVKGNSLVIVHWSTLWSQPQLKGKLLYPLKGVSLRVSTDGVTAELEFPSAETAQRALRICRMAQSQAAQANAPKTNPASSSAAPMEAIHFNLSPPATENTIHALLTDSCGLQPPSTQAGFHLWSTFLNGGAPPGSSQSHGTGSSHATSTTDSRAAITSMCDSLPSPPMSGTALGLLLDNSTAPPISAPLSSIFPNMFQSSNAEHSSGHGHHSQPNSCDSIGSYLKDEAEAKPEQPKSEVPEKKPTKR
uniref:RWP-RK domain-containing protein n=1 Tax=Hanusia phi TaxID=3032 RepID=A0A7S0E5L6_9CRYP|mmetsp:Transcript_16651/g.38013  ORF Transcript_16651/g.38013 Transcript_16651/m.38013 type:complete len:454 (+) Transcript_16651:594-1955(+)